MGLCARVSKNSAKVLSAEMKNANMKTAQSTLTQDGRVIG
jgi:hypothetical protein